MVLIKGRGGALLREKIVEVNSKAFICVGLEVSLIWMRASSREIRCGCPH